MTSYKVRVIYVVPKDAEPWGEAKERATELLEDLQHFFADEMDRLNYGQKTFEIARDTVGALIFHQIPSTRSKQDFQYRGETGKDARFVNCCKEAADVYGLRTLNDVVIYFFESYLIVHGVVSAGTRGGRAVPNRGLGGEAFISSLNLKMARREWISSDIQYDSHIADLKGRPKWENRVSDRLGDLSGGSYGITAHEFGHCLRAQHDRSADKRSLMDGGYKFMRGNFRPDLTEARYPKSVPRCEVSKQTAQTLHGSGFFDVRELKPRSPIYSRKS
jgi:hypothetical protein